MRSPAPFRTLAPILLAALAAGGCKSLEKGAREEFSRRYSCPEDRVEVRRRADVKAYDLVFSRLAPARPPDDVAADPARLAVWEKDEREKRETWNSSWAVFEARGCGHESLQSCSHPSAMGGGTDLAAVGCVEGEYPPGARKPW